MNKLETSTTDCIENVEKNNVKNLTCFSACDAHNSCCQRQQCKQWIDYTDSNNCVLIAAQKGPHTLQMIGQIYGLTRMRICQIEKNIFEKIKKQS